MHTLLWDGWWWFFFAVFKFVQVGIDRTVDVGFDPMTWWMREEKKKRNNNNNNLSIEDSIAVGIVIYSFSLLFPPPPPFWTISWDVEKCFFFLFYFFVSLSLFSPSLMIPYSRYQVQFMEFLFYFFFFIFQSSRSSHWVIFPFRNNFFFLFFLLFPFFFFAYGVSFNQHHTHSFSWRAAGIEWKSKCMNENEWTKCLRLKFFLFKVEMVEIHTNR